MYGYGRGYTGGLVGYAQIPITNCYATGTVAVTRSSYCDDSPYGPQYTGGLVGGSTDSVANSWTNVTVSSVQLNSGFSSYYYTNADRYYNYAGGIVGNGNGGSNGTKNCAALNSGVKKTADFWTITAGRVAGNESALGNNAAFDGMSYLFDGMLYSDDVNTGWPSGTQNNTNGLNISKADIQQGDGTVGGRFTSANGWTIVPGKLPGFVQAVELPGHLK